MFNKNLFFLVLSFFLLKTGYSQCETKNSTFKTGEYLEFSVWYNLGFIWAEAAKVSFLVSEKKINSESYWYFEAKGKTLSNYDWFFKVRDSYSSLAEKKTLKPVKFERNTSEGGTKKHNTYVFDRQNKLIYSRITLGESKIKFDTLKTEKCLNDLLSTMYKSRNINISNLKTNQELIFKILTDNEKILLKGKYEGKEIAEIKSGKKYKCVKFSATMPKGSMFGANDKLTVWVSDDKNKIPIKVEAEILIGSVKIFLEKYENLKNPFSSELKSE